MTISLLYTVNAITSYLLHKRMIDYCVASSREDGAPNSVVMLGKPGYLGYTSVYLEYLENGWIRVFGNNTDIINGQKMIAKFSLDQGRYTLTGLKDQPNDTIDFQLRIEDSDGIYYYLYQYDKDVSFEVDKPSECVLHIRVHPNLENINIMLKPAVYKDD